MKYLLIVLIALMPACSSAPIDHRIICVDHKAYFTQKYGPVTLVDPAPDADSICKS